MKLCGTASANNKNGMTFTLRRENGSGSPARLSVSVLYRGCRTWTFDNILEGIEDLEEGLPAINKFLAAELGSAALGREFENKITAENCFLIDSSILGMCWVFSVSGGYFSQIDGLWFYSANETPPSNIKSTSDMESVLNCRCLVVSFTEHTSESAMMKSYEIVEGYEKAVKVAEKQCSKHHHGVPRELHCDLIASLKAADAAREVFASLFGEEAYLTCKNKKKSK